MDISKKYGMKFNGLEKKLMVINGVDIDCHEFIVDGVTVNYLGSPITEDANLNAVIELHAQ